ncbi:DNA internalization-related competence protein ComEC/Rec2 [Solibacillus sp. FSL H8-0538]|uniref:DNA internalization-related competence protein ComEC/Rec2 n=1 Tax=Solibacillus sp. FSL H8-0538 TaxID=2921400 RepID=UPI0030FD177C
MHYLVNLFKHKWIFYALSILISAVAAHESAGLLFLLILLTAFCYYKGFCLSQIVALALVGLLSFYYFSYEVGKLQEPLQLPTTLTWTDEYKISGTTLRGFMKDAKGAKIYATYTLKSESEKESFQSTALGGHRFIVRGELQEPAMPAHRYGFSMAGYLMSKGARGILEISSLTYVGQANNALQPLYKQRFKVKRHIEQYFPKTLVAEAQALLIGLQENVDDELNRAYQKLGITHLFAISGLHVALISWLFFQSMLRVGVRRELASIILLVLLPMYAILAGGAPSVWRAVSVVELIMLARYLNWTIPIDDAMAMSFIVFVLLEPGVVFQVGFQLSYLATLSIIYSGQILTRYANWWMQSFFITFVCQILVYPLLLYHFFEISISSFIANIVFVPLFSFVILPVNIVLLIVTWIPGPFAGLFFELYEPCRLWLTDGILFLQASSYQMWNPGKPSLLWIIIMYVSVFTAFYFLDSRASYKKVAVVLLAPAIAFHVQPYLQKDLKLSFVNVGQGDCIVISLPHRKGIYLIDAGGLLRFEQEQWKARTNLFEVGREIVVPYLKGQGIQSVDSFILTHADADHVEGAEEVLREIRVKEVHVTPNSLAKPVMDDFLDEIQNSRTIIRERMSGHSWEQAGVQFSYLWPYETEYEGNNDSLVLLVQTGPFKALLTGDLEKEGEAELVKQAAAEISNVALLKAGHHGSKTSSTEEFIALTNPMLTIFMAGKNNRYKHPHAEVVGRFDDKGLMHLTTGEVGTVEVTITNRGMQVETSNEWFIK